MYTKHKHVCLPTKRPFEDRKLANSRPALPRSAATLVPPFIVSLSWIRLWMEFCGMALCFTWRSWHHLWKASAPFSSSLGHRGAPPWRAASPESLVEPEELLTLLGYGCGKGPQVAQRTMEQQRKFFYNFIFVYYCIWHRLSLMIQINFVM